MLKLNFLLAVRKLMKNKKSFFINLLGSSVGLAAVTLMSVYVTYENNYDSFNEHSDKLYRVERTVRDNVQYRVFDGTPYELSSEITNALPEVNNATSVATVKNYFSIDGRLFDREEGIIADNSFFEMFTFQFERSNGNNALADPMTIVVSESLAQKLFGSLDVLGKTVRLNKKADFTITAVFQDYPEDSHLNIDYAISYNSYERFYETRPERGWDKNYSCTYVMVGSNTDIGQLSRKMTDLLANHKASKDGIQEWLNLRPITDIYLQTSHVQANIMAGARNNMVVIYLFLGIVFFTAIITALNYIGLNTTQLMSRELEIGLKKVFGISKNQLRIQFIMESLIMILCIVVASLVLAYVCLPVFNNAIGRELSLTSSLHWMFLMLISSLVIGFFAGLYPVAYLSSLKINAFLQGNSSFNRKRFMRKALVVLQLMLAVPLIFNLILMANQIKFLKGKDVGFVKENIVLASIRTPEQTDRNNLHRLKRQLLQSPEVINYSVSEGAPFFTAGNELTVNWEGSDASEKMRVTSYNVDQDFLDTYQLKLLKGRWFSQEYAADSQSACVINETAAALLGWEDPIGKSLDNGRYKVVGLVRDFNQSSLFVKIPPMMLRFSEENLGNNIVSIRVHAGNRAATLSKINRAFNDNYHDTPIQFKYLDEGFDRGFMSVLENVMNMFMVFTFISVVLVIIGLFGLVSYAIGTQKKMIAVRRVLGASINSLFLLLTKEYLYLCGITMAISLTVTFALNSHFLNVFAYKVGIQFTDILNVIIITLVIVFIAIGGKIWSAIKERPLDALVRE